MDRASAALCIALSWFWFVSGYGREGLRFLERALAAQEQMMLPIATLARAEASPALPSPGFPAGLTARAVEVLRLLAQGWTDAQIAEQLVISPRKRPSEGSSCIAPLHPSG